MKRNVVMLLVCLMCQTPFHSLSGAATLKATYLFNDTLAAGEGGAPALTAIDPLGLSGYETTIVFGEARRVWRFDGAVNPPENQGGLTLPTSGLLTPNSYSVEVVALWFGRGVSPGAVDWRHITDVEDRSTDNGFYIDPYDVLDLFPTVGSGTTVFDINEFRHVTLTVSSADEVRAYLDGTLEFSTTTTIQQINNANNPGLLMHFFVDDTGSNFVQDWAAGQVALIRVWDGVLSDDQVAVLARDPFGGVIPEPSGMFLFVCGLVVFSSSRAKLT
jgi:hypothetical protein